MHSWIVPAESDFPASGPARSFDLRLVYAKTAAGIAEINQRKLGLSAPARRILIVIDGQRSLSSLPAFARAGELGAIIDELERHGLIALSGVVDTSTEPERQLAQRREAEALTSLKRALDGVFETELGPAGRLLGARIQDSVTVDVLRSVVREGIETVGTQRGADAATRLVALVRPLVMGNLPG